MAGDGGEFFDPDAYRGGNNSNNSGMQTLGAKNEFVRNIRQRSTLDTKRPSKGPAPTPPQGSATGAGQYNGSFKNDSDDEGHGMGQNMSSSRANAINMSLYGSGTTNTRSGGRNRSEMNNSEV